MRRKKVQEILVKREDEVLAVRVLLKFWIPTKKYPENGVWSYLIKIDDGVVVFDVGAEKGFWIKRTKNVKVVMEAMKEYFPGLAIKQILLSHYHYDHAGGAPLLQKMAQEEWGIKPPIRIHENDGQIKKFLKVRKSSLMNLFEKSGIEGWEIGDWLEDEEKLGESDWIVKHTPGHTSGAVSLINEREQVVIGGWLNEEIENRLVRWAQRKFIDEDVDDFDKTKRVVNKLKELGYTRYYLHPMLKKRRTVRERIKKAPTVKVGARKLKV